MRKKFIILSLCALGAAAIGFAACDGCGDEISNYLNDMKSSANKAVTVDAEVKLLDGDVTVYTFTRHMEIDTQSHTASVSDTKIILSDNFEETTSSTTSSVENVKGDTIIGLNLATTLLSEYEIKNGDLTCTVLKDNISEVLTKTVSASSDMTLSVDFENGNLTKAEYSYINASAHTVVVTVTYGY